MKLQVRIFVALVAMAIATAASTHVLWSEIIAPQQLDRAPLRALAEVFDAQDDHTLWSSPKTRRRLRALGRRFDVEFSVYDQQGHRVVGRRGPRHAPKETGALNLHGQPAHLIRSSDGRSLLVVARGARRGPPFWIPLLVVTVVFVLGSYLLSRGIVARLERMRRTVEGWGGALEQPRVEVQGNDEVAALARSFNHAADRIEELVEGQRRMLASASHELRTPMTRIRMATEMLRGENDASRRDDFADRIGQDLAELDELVHDILTSAKLEASEHVLDEVALSELVREELQRFEKDIEADIETEVRVRGVDFLLRRLIRNLMQNAFRYGGGSTPRVWLRQVGDDVQLRVEDDGPGIAASDRAHLFEPFFRAKDHHEGHTGSVGLGLYLVQQIVRVHRGEVRYAREDATSVFEVRLPVRERTP